MKPRVVFDTNILISALLSLNGTPFRCLALAREGLVYAVTCREILAELTDKLRTKFHYPTDLAEQVVEEIEKFSQVIEITNTLIGIVSDPDDDKVIECAVIGQATYIVSGDKRHLLPLKTYQGILIVSPTDFLQEIADSNS